MSKDKDKYEKRKEYHRAYYKTYKKREEYKKKYTAYMIAYKLRPENIEKMAAVRTAGNAIRDGKLIREPCIKCGEKKTEAHHEDYSKPLEVTWLCRKHHLELHKLLKATNS